MNPPPKKRRFLGFSALFILIGLPLSLGLILLIAIGPSQAAMSAGLTGGGNRNADATNAMFKLMALYCGLGAIAGCIANYLVRIPLAFAAHIALLCILTVSDPAETLTIFAIFSVLFAYPWYRMVKEPPPDSGAGLH